MSNPVKKPAFRFVFADEQTANRFLAEANRRSDVAYAQHPLTGDGSISRSSLEVLVTSCFCTGSNYNLVSTLGKRAMEMGGYYLPAQSVIKDFT